MVHRQLGWLPNPHNHVGMGTCSTTVPPPLPQTIPIMLPSKSPGWWGHHQSKQRCKFCSNRQFGEPGPGTSSFFFLISSYYSESPCFKWQFKENEKYQQNFSYWRCKFVASCPIPMGSMIIPIFRPLHLSAVVPAWLFRSFHSVTSLRTKAIFLKEGNLINRFALSLVKVT